MRENIHETKPVMENPINIPKTKREWNEFKLRKKSSTIQNFINIPNVPPTDPTIPISS